MVIIRLSRAGAKKRPFYHVVVTDSRRPRDSNSIEKIGYFNPNARGQEVRLHLELDKIKYWQGVGAQLSDRVSYLVKQYNKSATTSAEATEAKKPTKKSAKKTTEDTASTNENTDAA